MIWLCQIFLCSESIITSHRRIRRSRTTRPRQRANSPRLALARQIGFSMHRAMSLVEPATDSDLAALLGWPETEYRSEEHTSELQSLIRISHDDFCFTKKK